MNLSDIFGDNKSLASTLQKPTNTPAPKTSPGAGVFPRYQQNYKPKPIPNKCPFPVVWPEVPDQGVKDYQVITTESELRSYLDKGLKTGFCSIDWETSPSDDTRKRWNEYEKDLRYRLEAAEFTGDKKLIEAINLEYQGNGKKIKGKWQDFLETPLDPHQAEICCFSLAASPNEARVVFLSMKKGARNFEPKLSRNEARNLALGILESVIFKSRSVLKIAYNLAFESKFAAKYAMYILTPVSDPFIMVTRVMQIAAPEKIADPEKPQYGMDLKTRTEVLFGVKMTHFTELLARKKVNFFDELSTDDPDTVVYSAEDSDYGLQHHLYWDQIAKQIPNKNELYPTYSDWLHGIEMPFSRVIGLMEYHGLTWNHEEAEQKRKEAEQKLIDTNEEIKKLVFDTVGLKVNPGKTGKTKQMREAIFQALKLPVVAWTNDDEDTESLDNPAILNMIFLLENNLENLEEEELLSIPLPDKWEWMDVDNNTVKLPEGTFTPEEVAPIIQAMKKLKVDDRRRIKIAQRPPHLYKEAGLKLLELERTIQRCSTLLNMHIKNREKYLNPVTGRLHTTFTPWTRTSRLSSSKPPMQNTPRPENDYFGIRNFIKAPEGYILLFCDKKAFELRIMAWLSNDDTMIKAFNSNDDIEQDLHSITAGVLTNTPWDVIRNTYNTFKKSIARNASKSANFGVCYGGGRNALLKTLLKIGIRKSLSECQKIVDTVFITYPGIGDYHKNIVKQAENEGYVETIYGFKRLLPNINSSNKSDKHSDERRAKNTPDQGSASEIMKRDQNTLYEWIGENNYHNECDMISQIHDEVMFKVRDNPEFVQMAANKVLDIMSIAPLKDFPVPVPGEISVGYTWGNKMSLNKYLENKHNEK